MLLKYIFDIPVYRLTEDEYYSQLNKYVEGGSDYIKEIQAFYKKYPNDKIRFTDTLIRAYGGPWIYNEIIGFIRLHFLGSQIRGEYYEVDSKRITKTRKKQFKMKAWNLANEIEIPRDSTNATIFALFCEYLKNCEKKLKMRYIDTSLFKVVGPHVNWLELMNT